MAQRGTGCGVRGAGPTAHLLLGSSLLGVPLLPLRHRRVLVPIVFLLLLPQLPRLGAPRLRRPLGRLLRLPCCALRSAARLRLGTPLALLALVLPHLQLAPLRLLLLLLPALLLLL